MLGYVTPAASNLSSVTLRLFGSYGHLTPTLCVSEQEIWPSRYERYTDH
jgi:lambda repressor-like predicted transcriptional regulator